MDNQASFTWLIKATSKEKLFYRVFIVEEKNCG
jgi:hypothetical protein